MDKNEIYTKYLEDVYRYAFFKVSNKELAEDVTSETFVRLFELKDLKKFELLENKKGYIIGIARNIISDKFKENKYIKQDLSKIDEIVLDKDNSEIKGLNEELLNLLKKELYKLDKIDSEIIVLKVWEELKFNEIAILLNENINKVKAIYYRSVEVLTERLNNDKSNKSSLVSLPLVISALLLISKIEEFKLSSISSTTILSHLLTVNSKIMNNPVQSLITKISFTKGAILSTVSTKAVVVASTLIVASGVTVAGALAMNNQNKHSSVDQTMLKQSNNNSVYSSSQNSSSHIVFKKVGFNLLFDETINKGGFKFTLTSGNYFDEGYKVVRSNTEDTITYDVSDSKTSAEFFLPSVVYAYANLKDIVDLGKDRLVSINELKRFQAPLNSSDPMVRFYTNSWISDQSIQGYDKNPPLTFPYLSYQYAHPSQAVIVSCKPLSGKDYTICDNLVKSLNYI